jgi:O-acetyl-ADP-ribose deacetylase (regulator of RNase III)
MITPTLKSTSEQPRMKGLTQYWALGLISIALGAVGAGVYGPNHTSCADALTAAGNYSVCQHVDVFYNVALVLIGVGFLTIVAAITMGVRRGRL